MMLTIHTTKSQVWDLMLFFGTLTYDEATGEQILTVPRWIQVMWEHSSGVVQ